MFIDVIRVILHEFSDLSVVHAVQLTMRLLVAAAMGGLLGWEREKAGKSAGLRTHILVSAGSTAFVAVPSQNGIASGGLAPILQGLIAGIGFLGAGCIMKAEEKGKVEGLTTAAGVWFTAGVGVAAGMGCDASAVLLGLFGYLILAALGRFEHWRKPRSPDPEGEDRPATEAG